VDNSTLLWSEQVSPIRTLQESSQRKLQDRSIVLKGIIKIGKRNTLRVEARGVQIDAAQYFVTPFIIATKRVDGLLGDI